MEAAEAAPDTVEEADLEQAAQMVDMLKPQSWDGLDGFILTSINKNHQESSMVVIVIGIDLRLRNSGNPKLANSRFVSFIDKVSKAPELEHRF